MLILEIPKPHTPPIVVLESDQEFSLAAEAVSETDPQLARQLGDIAIMVHDEGLLPDSTRLEGHASEEVMEGLDRLAANKNVFAGLVLDAATRAEADLDEIDMLQADWPEDIVGYIQGLAAGPRSANIDPDATGAFKVEAELKNEKIAQQKAREVAAIDATYYPKLLATHRVPEVIG